MVVNRMHGRRQVIRPAGDVFELGHLVPLVELFVLDAAHQLVGQFGFTDAGSDGGILERVLERLRLDFWAGLLENILI
jgi:hypothetical protein